MSKLTSDIKYLSNFVFNAKNLYFHIFEFVTTFSVNGQEWFSWQDGTEIMIFPFFFYYIFVWCVDYVALSVQLKKNSRNKPIWQLHYITCQLWHNIFQIFLKAKLIQFENELKTNTLVNFNDIKQKSWAAFWNTRYKSK